MPRKKLMEPEELEQSAVLEQASGENTDAAAGEGDMLLPYTVDVMEIMTALRREWGVVYPEERG